MNSSSPTFHIRAINLACSSRLWYCCWNVLLKDFLWSFPVKSLLGPTENLPQQTVRTFQYFCRNSPWQPQNKSNKVWAPRWGFLKPLWWLQQSPLRVMETLNLFDTAVSCINGPLCIIIIVIICSTLWCVQRFKLMYLHCIFFYIYGCQAPSVSTFGVYDLQLM